MWRAKTAGEKRAEIRTRGLGQLSVAVLLWLDVAAPAPVWHGRRLEGMASAIHNLIPTGFPNLVAVALVLAACYWLFRPRAAEPGPLICEECNGVIPNNGRTLCQCGGRLFDQQEMKRVAPTLKPNPIGVSPRNQVNPA
jgi:hypothetical protein